MHSTSQELAFALRSPTSGPLAAVLCAMADLFEDPSFNDGHRRLLQAVLERGEIPQFLADRAAERLNSFASAMEDLHAQVYSSNSSSVEGDLPSASAPLLRRVV